jgi:hypothetical protein
MVIKTLWSLKCNKISVIVLGFLIQSRDSPGKDGKVAIDHTTTPSYMG